MEKKPFVGQMDRKIQIVEKTYTQNDMGEKTSTDTVVCEPFSQMEDIGGSEDVEGKVKHLVNRTYVIRYRSEVKSKANELFIIDDGKRFMIEHMIEIGRKSHLKLIARLYE